MTRKVVKWVLVALFLATGACDRAPDVPSSSTREDGASEVPGSAPEKATGPIGSSAMETHVRTRVPGVIQVPPGVQFGGVATLAEAKSFKHQVDALPKDEQRFLWATYMRYGTVFWYGSPEGQRELAELGMPMPDDWLAARRMGDEELEALADSGNYKAQIFVADRLMTRNWRLRRPAADLSKRQKFQQDMELQRAIESLEELTRRTKLPFGILLIGRIESLSYPGCEPVVASYMVVARLWPEQFDSGRLDYKLACMRDPEVDLRGVAFFNAHFSRLIEGPPRGPW